MKMYLPLVLLIASSQLVHAQPSDLHPIYRASSVEVLKLQQTPFQGTMTPSALDVCGGAHLNSDVADRFIFG